ncbi:SDR family NAD(P)-dependent oxidoreductase [Embleya hyalina]|uniref:Putative short chain dehydrogenase/reductase n=1 Tax=Embleya hyalina TaxID=516124 RepID=A0A401Z576_9ACTN|nr:SDR family NAD(P)-dependent oxidoreductase [Embleya hyalina]GCE02010.1 putative short chain dehydrogenase/reductase [Embleya hyalina]
MIRDYAGRVCTVTGAASGIGQALAFALAEHGARLALADVDTEGLDTTARRARELGAEQVHVDVVDVARREQVQDWADTTAERFGQVNLVINNAGVALTASVDEMEWADFEWIMGINFWGVAHGTKSFLPHLRRADPARGAHLVNVSSSFGLFGMPQRSAYSATKYAVRGFSESVRNELRREGSTIGVTTAYPGGIRTSIVRNSRAARGTDRAEVVAVHDSLSKTSPEHAARVILGSVRKRRTRVCIGLDAKVMDLGTRLLGSAFEPVVHASIERARAKVVRQAAPLS